MDSPSPQYDVFLSHNSADKPVVEAIGSRLRKEGFYPFLDKWHLVPGKPWQTELAEALEASECVAIFFGPSGEGSWHNEEMQLALNKAVRTRDDYRVIPVLLPESDPSQVGGFLELRTWVDFRPGPDDEVAFQRLTAAIKGVAPESADVLVNLPDAPRPYRGIERFEGEQQQFFFGRDDEILRLIQRMEQDRFVAVVGASGSGKSSLARAGFHTDVAEQAQPGIRGWHRIVLMPKSNPLLQLAANLVAHLPEPERPALIRTFLDDFRRSADGLITALTTLFPNPGQPVLLLVDQFEELFTQRPASEQDQTEWRDRTASFASNLLAVIDQRPDWLRVIVTLRADFVDRFVGGDFPEFRTLLERRQFWLGAMAEEDLREVIVRPATGRGAFFEKGLVERILADMHGEASALPLLEEALDSLWDKRRGPWLTHQAYDEIGGVGGALAGKADRIFNSLSESQQAIARRVFLKLVQLGEGARDTRRRVSIAHLRSVTDDPSEFQGVLVRFSTVGARLITFSSDEEDGEDDENSTDETAEVTHEALIDHWDPLSLWLDEGRDDARLERRLEEAAKRWQAETEMADGKPEGVLWRPPDLDLARDYLKRIEGSLPELLFDFYQYSDRAEKERIAKEEQQRQREIQHAKQQKAAATRFKWIASIAAVVAVVAIGVGIVALDRNRRLWAESNKSSAAAIMAALGGDNENLTVDEYESLGLLAYDSLDVRMAFMEHLLSSSGKSIRLRSRLPHIVHAVVGLDPQAKEQCRLCVWKHGQRPKDRQQEINVACAEIGLLLDVEDDDFNRMIAANFLADAEKSKTESGELKLGTLLNLGRNLRRLGDKLPTEQAKKGAQTIVDGMDRFQAERTASLARRLGSWGDVLPRKQAMAGAKKVLLGLEMADYMHELVGFGDALVSLSDRLPAEQVEKGTQVILTQMKDSTVPRDTHGLGNALSSLVAKLPAERAARLAEQIVSAMNNTNDPHQLSAFGGVLERMGEKLPDAQAEAGIQRIVDAMEMYDSDQLSTLALSLGDFGARLPRPQAQSLALRISDDMKPDNLHDLTFITAFVSLGEKLPPEQAVAGIQRIVATIMDRRTYSLDHSDLVQPLGSLCEQLPPQQVATLAGQMVAALENAYKPKQMSALGDGLVVLCEKIETPQARALAQQIVEVMKKGDADQMFEFGRALVRLDSDLAAEQAAALAERILTDDVLHTDFRRALGRLGETLPPDQAEALAEKIVADMRGEDDAEQIFGLGRTLAAFGRKLSPAQAAFGIWLILGAMEQTSDPSELSDLQDVLGSLAKRLEKRQFFSVLKSLVCVGDVRDDVLAALEEKTDHELDGNLWRAVEWGESQGIKIAELP